MYECSFLLVDDDLMGSRILSTILKNAGFNCSLIAHSGDQALVLLDENIRTFANHEKERIGIIITDLYMPSMDGIELCRNIRNDDRYITIPVIMITASEDVADLEKAFDAGVHDYIHKPFVPIEILTRIKSALKLKEETEKRLDRERELEVFNHNLVEDLNVAVQLQRQMLPNPIDNQQLKLLGFYLPFAFLGGDLYYWCELDENRYGVVLLDVMGHGTATCMISMYLRSIIPDLMKKSIDAKGFVTMMNDHMYGFNQQIEQNQYYCTLFYLIIDCSQRTIEYVNAGHPPALMIYNNNVIHLTDGCSPIGLFDKLSIESGHANIDDQTVIYLYSDGMMEAFRTQGLDMNYLINDSNNWINSNTNLEDTFHELRERVEALPRFDDISIIQVKLFGEGSK